MLYKPLSSTLYNENVLEQQQIVFAASPRPFARDKNGFMVLNVTLIADATEKVNAISRRYHGSPFKFIKSLCFDRLAKS